MRDRLRPGLRDEFDRHADPDVLLGVVSSGSLALLRGDWVRDTYYSAKALAKLVDQPTNLWPRAWRRQHLDITRGSLHAYHILNVADRSTDQTSYTAVVWSRIGIQVASSRHWTNEIQEFRMLEMMALAAAKDQRALGNALARYRSFQSLDVSSSLQREYYSRKMDLLQQAHRWREASDLVESLILPSARRYEPKEFLAARILQAARGRIRTFSDVGPIAVQLAEAHSLLDLHAAESGSPHRFFEYFHHCVRAEFEAMQGRHNEASTLLADTESTRRSVGLPRTFLNEAKEFELFTRNAR